MYEFIKSELTEAKLLRNEQNLPKTAETLADSLFTHVLTLEILRHEDPSFAKDYAKKILQYPNLDRIRTSSTDLHNQIAVINNKDLYADKIAVPSEINIPFLQIKTYLRNVANEQYDSGFTRQFLYKLQKFLSLTNQQLINARRAVQEWPALTAQEKQGALAILKRQYLLHSRRSDMYPKFSTIAKKAGVTDDKQGMSLAKKAAIAFGAGYALGKLIK